ncbi:uncharacterized [Tachysurus ichikawai]
MFRIEFLSWSLSAPQQLHQPDANTWQFNAFYQWTSTVPVEPAHIMSLLDPSRDVSSMGSTVYVQLVQLEKYYSSRAFS